jgi:hypothetical protein
MTLVITAACFLICAVICVACPALARKWHVPALTLMYAGASLMWCVDGFFNLAAGEGFINLTDSAQMQNDALLGACVAVLGLVAWGVIVLVKRHQGRRQVVSQ